MTNPKSIWIFDVDGVIANPQEKKVTEPEILDYIAKKLRKEEPVTLNTGRSLIWLTDRVINPLLEKIKNKKTLKNFFASGEKGGTWVTFDNNGQMKYHKDESISIPLYLQQTIKNLINSEFSESMFYDDTKETMISIEMKDKYSIDKFKIRQKELNKRLQELIAKDNSDEKLKIDPTTIATDVENKHAGKGFAVQRILKWLKENNIKPQKYITFGDSLSDIPMAEMLYKKGKNVEFIFVGKSEIKKSYAFPLIHTKELYGKGTVEALKSL